MYDIIFKINISFFINLPHNLLIQYSVSYIEFVYVHSKNKVTIYTL